MVHRSRIMGAGLAGATSFGVSVNADGAGGSKKQGLAGMVGFGNLGRSVNHVRRETGSTPLSRSMIYSMGQMSGVGRGVSAFNVPGMYTRKDGARTVEPFPWRKKVRHF